MIQGVTCFAFPVIPHIRSSQQRVSPAETDLFPFQLLTHHVVILRVVFTKMQNAALRFIKFRLPHVSPCTCKSN